MEKSLLAAMEAMEDRLVAKIESTARDHEGRHGQIDAFMTERALVSKFRAGQIAAISLPIKALEAATRYRWLLLLLLGLFGMAAGKIEVDIIT